MGRVISKGGKSLGKFLNNIAEKRFGLRPSQASRRIEAIAELAYGVKNHQAHEDGNLSGPDDVHAKLVSSCKKLLKYAKLSVLLSQS